MRMSCNGCRVLRKGCSENCSLRPCLQWIKNPESQANATVFLAKFYGRAGLMNLINAGPEHLRPAIFRSLLYEACGRIVNPIYGSVGLLWSGSWQLCQDAVEYVLKGVPIVPIPSETVASAPAPPLKAYDIRHVSKEPGGGSSLPELHKVGKCRTRFKRSGAYAKAHASGPASPESSGGHWCYAAPVVELQRAQSHESAGSGPENDSMFSEDSVEASHVSQGEPSHSDESEVVLELTLGHEKASRRADDSGAGEERRYQKTRPADEAFFGFDLQLELAA